MWFADIYCDIEWVAARNGDLGPRRMRLSGPRSASLGIAIEFHFFGDNDAVRHVRALMDTKDRQAAETCVDLNIQTWVAALEAAVMMQTERPFHVARVPGTQMFAVGLGESGAEAPAAIIRFQINPSARIDYQRVAFGLSAWGGETQHHLFYFRRLVDDSLPLDVRWLNGYRLLKWHFVQDRAGLSRSPVWRTFVARFDEQLVPLTRPGQSAVGLLEEARALAAHAGLDDRPETERRRDPRNAMEKTFRALERMVMTVLNEHPERAGHPVQFGGRA
jgi:hypothetical protein